jgi:hypothetical protein
MSLSELAKALDIALTVVTHRLLTLLALIMTFGLFCVAMSQADWLHLCVAGAFAAFIFLPVLAVDRRPEAPWQQNPSDRT